MPYEERPLLKAAEGARIRSRSVALDTMVGLLIPAILCLLSLAKGPGWIRLFALDERPESEATLEA